MFVMSDKNALYCVKWSAPDKSSIQVLNVMMKAKLPQNLLSHQQLSIDHSVPIRVDGGGELDSLLLVDVSSRLLIIGLLTLLHLTNWAIFLWSSPAYFQIY